MNLGRLNKIVQVCWPMMVGEGSVGDKAVATDKVLAATHDIRKLFGLDVKEAAPGSTPARPLHVSAVPGEIDWDAIPEDLAERFLALNAELVALQPASGGLVIGENGASVG